MSFIRNAWYCAGWSHELEKKPLARTLLNEKLALYRTNDGVAAIGDVCPHRYSPLSQGKIKGDRLMCPYHGIEFGPNGKCAHNPHGAEVTALNVVSYKVIERQGALWIWMGDPSLANLGLIPEMTNHDNPDFSVVYSYLHIRGHYELVSDNLLDLSHTQYLHDFLKREVDDGYQQVRFVKVEDDVIVSQDEALNAQPIGFVKFAWPDSPERIDSRASTIWKAPANMMLHITFAAVGESPTIDTWGAQLVTPETDKTSHYFWTQARNFRHSEEFSQMVRAAIQNVFETEDGRIISEIQKNLGNETDLLAIRPVLLKTDTGAIRARRIVKTRIAIEAGRGGGDAAAAV